MRVAITTQEEYSDEVEAGQVIRTDPAAGEELEPGASIDDLSSARARRKQTTSVPDLYGMTQEAARQALTESRGLSLGVGRSAESDESAGTVVWQSIDPETEVDEGTAVNIQISKRPQRAAATAGDSTDDGKQGRQSSAAAAGIRGAARARDHGSATMQVSAAGQHGYGACRGLGGRRGAV